MYLCTAIYVGVVIRLLGCVGHFKHVCVYSKFALCVDVSGILKPVCFVSIIVLTICVLTQQLDF